MHSSPDAPIDIATETFSGPDATNQATDWLDETVSEFMLEEQPVPA